jgi:hypothetical protein
MRAIAERELVETERRRVGRSRVRGGSAALFAEGFVRYRQALPTKTRWIARAQALACTLLVGTCETELHEGKQMDVFGLEDLEDRSAFRF